MFSWYDLIGLNYKLKGDFTYNFSPLLNVAFFISGPEKYFYIPLAPGLVNLNPLAQQISY